jgi:hypothetical protein
LPTAGAAARPGGLSEAICPVETPTGVEQSLAVTYVCLQAITVELHLVNEFSAGRDAAAQASKFG